jgi:1-acyl-sn-glycerol-3-phosphate acyltransferase
MNLKEKIFFYFQYSMGRLMVFITAPLILLAIKACGYRVRDLGKIRQSVRDMQGRHQGPWLICANHLTLIDSVILAYAMMPIYRYMFQYKLLPWNVPEQMNFNRNIFVGLVCFLTKCIPIIRGGDRDAVKSTLSKCAYLLDKGENLMIFPEGTRSRSGRVNTKDFPYGVGRLVCNIPDCRVMAIYLRGDRQKTFSDFPRRGERFTMIAEECRPKTDLKGLRAQRDCSGQIVTHLARMEKDYFESCG